MEWTRQFSTVDGFYEFMGWENGKAIIHSGRDVDEGLKCRELWEVIKKKYPEAKGYKSFCFAYRVGKYEWEQYCEREEYRYRKFWGKRG